MTLLKNFWVKYKTLQFKLKEKIGLKQAKNLLQHDQILVSKVKKANRLPSWKQLKYAGKLLSKTEYIIVRLALGIAGIAILAILLNT